MIPVAVEQQLIRAAHAWWVKFRHSGIAAVSPELAAYYTDPAVRDLVEAAADYHLVWERAEPLTGHGPMPVNGRGEGPADEADTVATICWCDHGLDGCQRWRFAPLPPPEVDEFLDDPSTGVRRTRLGRLTA